MTDNPIVSKVSRFSASEVLSGCASCFASELITSAQQLTGLVTSSVCVGTSGWVGTTWLGRWRTGVSWDAIVKPAMLVSRPGALEPREPTQNCVGAQYTGGKYAALLDNKAVKALE